MIKFLLNLGVVRREDREEPYELEPQDKATHQQRKKYHAFDGSPPPAPPLSPAAAVATAGDLRLGATVAVLAPGGGGATGAVSFRWSRAPTPDPKPVAPASHDAVDDAAPLSSRARFGPLPRTLRPASAVAIATGVCGATSPMAAQLLVTTADDEEGESPC